MNRHETWLIGLLGTLGTLAAGCGSHPDATERSASQPPAPSPCVLGTPSPTVPHEKPPTDLSGCKRVGQASFYAKGFGGKPMAGGAPMNPQGINAASRTLPIGTTAKVTNLETGQSAVVVIEDRGPYAKGRLLDLSPSTARKIGITPHAGVAPVTVAPIAVPLPDGSVKLGVAAPEVAPKAPADNG